MTMSLLDTLNSEQYEAVTTTEGPLLLLAGAGSGKTRVIVYRIAYLIQEKQVRPEQILAVTFTNKAAEEMRARVEKLIAESGVRLASPPLISTFHSLCVRILRRDIDKLDSALSSYTRDFTIYDSDDQARVIRNCMNDLNIDQKVISVRSIQSGISSAKSKGISWESLASAGEGYGTDLKRETIAQVYKLYQERLERSNALDFDDLLLKTVSLLKYNPQVRERYNEKFGYILIDEYQDTNPPQFALVRLLTEKQQNLCVVGDPDQSIYKFRSADIQNILDFEKHYPQARTIKLVQNYRSTKVILETANRVIRNNTQRREKDLRTENEHGEKIRYYQAYDGDREAAFVAERVQQHTRQDPKTRCVVLYRTNSQSRLFEEAFRRLGIRYQIIGGFSFYERAEVKDVIAYLKLILNPHDNVSLTRVINTPARGIGAATLEKIEATARLNRVSNWEAIELLTDTENSRAASALNKFRAMIEKLRAAADDLKIAELIKCLLQETRYIDMLREEHTEEAESRIFNLEELVSAAAEADEQEESLMDFLDHAALVSDTDSYQSDVKVSLMTIHSAKGLEFPVVFLVGMEQGLFPNARASQNVSELEEERRLCYVGITRAERYLYLTHALSRRIYGESKSCEPSQFLNEMPADLMEDLSRGSSWLQNRLRGLTASSHTIKRTSNYGGTSYNSVDSVKSFLQQKPSGNALKPGTHVKHPKYGYGLILKREGEGDSAKLLVSFPGYGQKKFIEKFANLEKV